MQNINFDYVVVMDADGEDRPEEIVMLLDKMGANSQFPVVAKRVKRSEGLMFRILYQIHKIITYIFTGKIMNFGNFVCLTKDNVSKIINEKSLWNNFSGTIRNKFKKLESINCIRGNRYFGPSKMSFLKLFIHSMSIISVFNKVVYLRSILYLATAFLLELFFSLNIFNKNNLDQPVLTIDKDIENSNGILYNMYYFVTYYNKKHSVISKYHIL